MGATNIRRTLSTRSDDVIVTDCTYHIGFDEIVKILNKKPILTGIVLLNDPGSWADEIKNAGVCSLRPGGPVSRRTGGRLPW